MLSSLCRPGLVPSVVKTWAGAHPATPEARGTLFERCPGCVRFYGILTVGTYVSAAGAAEDWAGPEGGHPGFPLTAFLLDAAIML